MLPASDIERVAVCSASRDSDVALVSQLLANHSFDADGATAALEEEFEMNPTVIRILLQHGANARAVSMRMIPLSDEPVNLHHDLLLQAYRLTHLRDFAHDRETLDWLLDQGADINRTDSQRLDSGFNLAYGETDSSLHLLNNVAANGDIELFDHLVKRGADTSLCTALHAASRCTDAEMSKAMVCHLLDKYNMDINRNNDDLRHFFHDSQDDGSPLCSAILHKNLAVVHELLQRGAKVNSPHRFPVTYAVRTGGFFPALEPLLSAGADATEALKLSVILMNFDAAKACLQYGADPALALRKAIEQEEYRANTIAENAAFRDSQPGSNYKKSERQIEKERAEERESQAMIALLRSVMG